MASIPKSSIKALVKRYFKAEITEDGANEIARILERKANEISAFAVKNARARGRDKVTKEDITQYLIKGFDEQ
jgi:histone H3/H4